MSESGPPEERAVRPSRIAAQHPVLFRRRAAQGAMTAPEIGRMLDVSETGFLLQSARPLELGAEVELEIATAGQLLFARGVLVRTQPADDGGFELGLRWTGIPNEALLALLYPA